MIKNLISTHAHPVEMTTKLGDLTMRNKTYQTAVVIIPPKEIWASIQLIREQHDIHYRRWMPHITLLYPFRPRAEFGLVVDRLSHACQGRPPFWICLELFRFFSQHRSRYTVWLDPQPPSNKLETGLRRRNPVKDLQQRLWGILPDCDDTRRFKNGFNPHLSVGQVTSKHNLDNFLCQFQPKWQPLTFYVSEVHLIWRNDPPNDVFEVDQTIAFS